MNSDASNRSKSPNSRFKLHPNYSPMLDRAEVCLPNEQVEQKVLFGWLILLFGVVGYFVFRTILRARRRTRTERQRTEQRLSDYVYRSSIRDERALVKVTGRWSKFTCVICFDEKKAPQMFAFHRCTHEDVYCSVCLTGYIRSEFAQSRVEIDCPIDGCDRVIPIAVVRRRIRLNPEQFDERITRWAIKRDTIECPRCRRSAFRLPRSCMEAVCPYDGCGQKLCTVCTLISRNCRCRIDDWVAQEETDGLNAVGLFGGMNRNEVRLCPGCKIGCQMPTGCPNTRCAYCGHRFKWTDAERYLK